LLWAKGGDAIGNTPSKDWHKATWYRMRAMFIETIAKMSKLSSNTTVVYADTTKHFIFYEEPLTVVAQINNLLAQIKNSAVLLLEL
jgi:hypothetical protein